MNVKLYPKIDKDNKVYILFKYRNNGVMNNKDFLLNSVLRSYLTKDIEINREYLIKKLIKGEAPMWQGEDNDDYMVLNLIKWDVEEGLSSNGFYFELDLARLEDSFEKDNLKDIRNEIILKAVSYITTRLYKGLYEDKDKKELEENYKDYIISTIVSPNNLLSEIKHKFTVEGLGDYEGVRLLEFLKDEKDLDATDLFDRLVKIYQERYTLKNLDIYVIGDVEKDDTLTANIRRAVEGYIAAIASVDLKDGHYPVQDIITRELSLKNEKTLMGYSVSNYTLPPLKGEDYNEEKDSSIYSMLVYRNSLEKIKSVKDLAMHYFIGELLNEITDDKIDIEVDYPNYAEIHNDKPELHIIVEGTEISDVMKDVVVDKLGNYFFNLENDEKLLNAKKVVLKNFRFEHWEIQTILADNGYSEEDFIKGLKEFTLEELKEYIHNFNHITTVQGRYYN